jgi:hypothetical protein
VPELNYAIQGLARHHQYVSFALARVGFPFDPPLAVVLSFVLWVDFLDKPWRPLLLMSSRLTRVSS